MAHVSIELNTGKKYSVDAEYPHIVTQLDAARKEGRMVQLKLFAMTGPGSEIQVNPQYVVSVQPMPG